MSDIELTTKQSGKIRRAMKALNDVREEVQKENPKKHINWYFEGSGDLILCDGDVWGNEEQHPEVIINQWHLPASDAGGW